MTAQVIPRDKLGVLSKIGQGGQGVVYRAPNVKTKFAASMVYKEYKPQARTDIDFTALAAMPALVEESLTYSQAERLISIAAWPCAIIEDAGTPTGFVMPAIPEEFFIPLTTAKGVSPTTAEFQHLLNHPSVLAARGITLDDAQRFTLLRETASALVFLHKHGVCVGDISRRTCSSPSPHTRPSTSSTATPCASTPSRRYPRWKHPDGTHPPVKNWPPSTPTPTNWACWPYGCSPATTTPPTPNTSPPPPRPSSAKSSPTPSPMPHKTPATRSPGPTSWETPSNKPNTAERPQPQHR